jgi:hypothetical protein
VQHRRIKALAFALVILLAPRMSLLCADEPQQIPRVTPDAEWNAVFDRTDGWTGADCAGSVDLGDGRTLWMFGDTWIGNIRNGKRQPGATMVNNSIAVHPTDKAAPWRRPDPRSVQFVWGSNDKQGHPTAWVVPQDDPKQSVDDRDWFWCNGGGVVGVGANEEGRRLIVFLFRTRRNPNGKGVWNFTTVGTSFAVIDNVADPPGRWRSKINDIPGTGQIEPGAGNRARLEILLGMSAASQRSADDPGRMLIFGTRQKGLFDTSLVMARAKSAAIERFGEWRFIPTGTATSSSSSVARPLAPGLVSEFSVEQMKNGGKPTWVMIHSEPLLGKRVFVRTAPQPEGPWSPPRAIFSVPEVATNRAYFTYAAKGHAQLSRPGELLVTYLVNSHNFGDLVSDTTIYHPKFLRVPAAILFGK